MIETSRGGSEMGFIKHGSGEILPENEGQKTASKDWSEQDQQELADENKVDE